MTEPEAVTEHSSARSRLISISGDTDKQNQDEMEDDGCVTAALHTASSSTAPTTSATAVSSTPRSSTPTDTQPNGIPLGNITSDRQAVQVIQQTLHRSQSMTAQYLQQMYAAQQQHILLQTAALQQQHQQNLTATQILTTTEQATQTNGRQLTSSPPSSNGNVTRLASVSQTSITMPTSPVTQPIGRIQVTSSNSTAGAISQQAMLLGNSSPTGSQAQMYLRTQMLILTPAATVAAVQPDLTVVSSVSSQSASSQVQSLALRTHLRGALATPQNVQIKPSLQGQTLVSPQPKMSICPLKSTRLSQNLAETSRTTFTPVQSHTLVRHQLHCPSGQRVAPHQLIIQQSSTAQRQVQPIALRVMPQDSSPPPLALQSRTTPTTATVQSQHTEFLSVPNHPSNQSAVVSTSTAPPAVLPDPPTLHLGPVLEPVSQYSPLSSPPPLTMALPRLVQPQRLSLRSVQTVAVQSDHMLVSEEELPVTEAVVQLPFQNLPPPQTVAVDLKVQPATQTEAPSATPLLKESGSMDLVKDVEHACPQNRTPTPPPLSPPDEPQESSDDATTQPENSTADLDQPSIPSSRSVIRSQEDPTYANSSPPPLLSSAVRSTSRLPPASLPGNPEGRPTHILTHLIEGFVIREGLEPFPVRHASLEMNLQATLPEDRENGESAQDDCLMDADQPENSTDSDIDNPPAEDEQTVENLPDVLECEFCGKRGFARTFLRSKRFCSMTCVRRFNVSCKKRLNLFSSEKVGRWPHRPMGKRGRPPSRINGRSREHFLRQQLQDSHRTSNNPRVSNSIWIEREEEEDPPGPMTTRLRLQAEREKEQDREREQSTVESSSSSSSSDCLLDSSPSQWNVEQVCSFISSLPGCHDIAAEFCSQEIDGQALLLLTEDHLMSAMNIRLGPALKICAQINALKEH
ncbi:polyhomeotic-like protein 3 isoform X4 [Sinocyclocheilus rhinocerous]|uniref:polyhomeotic-like protein 3 isoform X4 n=1 Tax=Sinocyclocheilus rhinocerous TaxID=307959 RepID=UPI0007B83C72|nr:PREDICTED: polyhomeotic-like protein 3 isoform X4 [Sinocyclocheilus rhinocerous]